MKSKKSPVPSSQPVVRTKSVQQRLMDAMKSGVPFYDMIDITLASGSQGTGIITNQDGRPFVITEMINTSAFTGSLAPSSDFTFRITDTGSNYQMSYVPVHGSCLGSNKLPSKLEIPYVLRPTADLKFELQNVSTAEMRIQILVKGYKINDDSLSHEIEKLGLHFWDMFTIQSATGIAPFVIAANSSVKSIISNRDRRTFFIKEFTCFAKNNVNAETRAFKYYFRDSGSKEVFSMVPVSGASIGTGEYPSKYDAPYALSTQRQFECEVSNELGVQITVYIVLKGIKPALV